MTTMAVESLIENPAAALARIGGENLLVTRDGRPFVLLTSVEGMDEEDVALQSSPEFWESIQAARAAGDGIPIEEFEARLRALEPESGR